MTKKNFLRKKNDPTNIFLKYFFFSFLEPSYIIFNREIP